MKGGSLLAAMVVCAMASGCTRVQEAMMSEPDKINAAYPVVPEVRIVQERLQALTADDSQAAKALQAQIDARMKLRALNCAKNVQIGRFDSVASVRAKTLDIACFQEQDASLQAFYGMRTVGALLALPPLRPARPLGQARLVAGGKLKYVESAVVASRAGVGVLRDSSGEGVLMALPEGQIIATLPRRSYGSDAISPNGRVIATGAQQQGLTFVDAETGGRLWEFAEGGRLVDWLAPLQSVLLSLRSGELMLGDGVSGSVEPHPLAGRSALGITLEENPVRVLIGSSASWSVAEHARTPEGIQATVIRKISIDRNSGGSPTSEAVPMRAGKLLVYPSAGDIGWLDLKTGDVGKWRTAPYFHQALAKLDETHLLLVSTDGGQRKLWSLDVDAQTVTPVDTEPAVSYVRGLGRRNGFLMRGADAWIGDQVTPSGEVADLHKVVSEYALQQQLRKLQQMIDAEKAALAATSIQSTGIGGTAVALPGLAGVPPNAQVHIVGVYEGKGDAGRQAGSHVKRDVRVAVRSGGRPIVLALASYEPVNWIVENAGTPIAAVLLSGYYPSSVSGAGSATVMRIGSAYAYSRTGGNYDALRNNIVQYTGAREIRSFQGAYAGAEFSVGGT